MPIVDRALVSTTGDKAVALTGTAFTNTLVAAAPAIQQQMGQASIAGGPEINLIAMGLNGIAQPIKMFTKVDQDRYLGIFLLCLAMSFCLALWGDDLRRGFLNGIGAYGNAVMNYGLLKPLGVLSPGTPTEKDAVMNAYAQQPPLPPRAPEAQQPAGSAGPLI